MTKQKKYLEWLTKQDTDSPNPSPNKYQLRNADPIKVARKHAKWVVTAQMYIVAVNQVLKQAAAKRATAVKKLIADLKPPQFCLGNLATDNFLDGTLTTWNAKGNVIKSSEEKLGFLECTVCEKHYK